MEKYFFNIPAVREFFYALPIGIIIGLIFVFILIKNPEKIQLWAGLISGFFGKIMKTRGYFSIKNEVEGKINSYLVNFEYNTDTLFPRARIKWVGRDEKEEIVFEDYETIIVVRNKEHRNKNFVHAAYFFTSQVLLNKVKDKLSEDQKKAFNLFATKNILEEESRASVEQFVNDYLKPEIEGNEIIKAYISKFFDIDKAGIFFSILIKELDYLGKKIVLLDNKKGEIIDEVKNLIDFLQNFSKRNEGDHTPEVFVGVHTKCAIKIIASAVAREHDDIVQQAERIVRSFHNGCENIYIVGRVEEGNKKFMERVAKEVINSQEDGLIQLSKKVEFSSEIRRSNGRCKQVKTFMIHFHCPNNTKSIYK